MLRILDCTLDYVQVHPVGGLNKGLPDKLSEMRVMNMTVPTLKWGDGYPYLGGM
jgi:hypothetical protein